MRTAQLVCKCRTCDPVAACIVSISRRHQVGPACDAGGWCCCGPTASAPPFI